MGFEVKIEGFDADKISKRIFDNDRVGLAASQALFRHMSPYVPRDSGTLMTSVRCKPWAVEYISPYAHFQFIGKLMVSPSGSAWAKKNERKHYVNKSLIHSKDRNPNASAEWNEAMLKGKKKVVMEEIQRLIERGGK